MSSIERSAHVVASPDEIWSVLSDFGALSSWVPMIQHSCLLTEQTDGVGATRRVQIMHQTLVERVTVWEPGRRLAYAIEGLPPIVGNATNTWRIAATPSGCDVTLTTEIDTGRSPVKGVVAKRVLDRMATASEFMLAGLDQAVGRATPAIDEQEASS